MSRAQLKKKYEKNESFKKQAKKAQKNYQLLVQKALYSNLATGDSNFILKYDGKNRMDSDIYIIHAQQQRAKAKTLQQLTLTFVKCIPKPTRNYSIVYLNDQQNTGLFSDLKTVLEIMPIEYFLNLVGIFLVKPTFFQKAGMFFVFGVIPKFINSVVVCVENLQQLSQKIVLSKQQIIKYIPKDYFQNQKQQKHENLHIQKIDPINNQIKNHKQDAQTKKLQIDQYQKAENGLPQIFQIFVYYFQVHSEGLQIEGIFRKSASIEDLAQIKNQISKKRYSCIGKIKNPHIVANLVKQFLGNLNTPIIPYQIFNSLMSQQMSSVQFLNKKMKELKKINLTKLLTLMFLIQFLHSSVIIHSAKNKMNVENIAICFSPCIMWAQQRSLKDLIYATKSVSIVKKMLNNFEQVFGSPKDQKKLYRESYMQHKNKTFEYLLPNCEQKQHENIEYLHKQQQVIIKKVSSEIQQQDQSDEGQSYKNVVRKFIFKQKQPINQNIMVKIQQQTQMHVQILDQKSCENSKRAKKGIFASKIQKATNQKNKGQVLDVAQSIRRNITQ